MTSLCHAEAISGSVKGADGAAFQGAFVEAQNIATKIRVLVLSDEQGRYRIEKLPAGEYRMQVRAVGFRAEPRSGVKLASGKTASQDFSLQKGTVRWSDISMWQAKQLWPSGKGQEIMLARCATCHLFQSRMAAVTRDEEGYKDRIQYMKTVMGVNISDQDAPVLASYLASLFGPDSVLPKLPTEMPQFKETVRPFSNDAMNIVYVEYDLPGPSRMPFSAAPDGKGFVWIPNYGAVNKVTRLDPKTGEMKDFTVPNVGTANIHSAVPTPDGSLVWMAETIPNKLGRLDTKTQTVTEFVDGSAETGSKHTARVDIYGNVWASGEPLTKFDPKTGKFTHFPEVKFCYDVKPDKNGDVWFTNPSENKIGRVDGKTLKVTQWSPPTRDAFPRRMEIAADGMVWFGEFRAGKMARFDPATETFKEYPLPGKEATPYAMGFDADGYLWYNSHFMDVVGRFDTKTGDVIEYPFPHAELAMREFFRDSDGRMWYGTNPNNRVGYFYLANKRGAESARK
jgi:virginiamycin B lyase